MTQDICHDLVCSYLSPRVFSKIIWLGSRLTNECLLVPLISHSGWGRPGWGPAGVNPK